MLSEMVCRRSQQDGRGGPRRDPSSRRTHGWSKGCRGRGVQGRRAGAVGWPRGPQPPPQQRHHPHPRPFRRPAMSLRPVNIKGNLARGMRAPKNTNQFLMHEKYQMLHMRSDSVGSDSGSGSDSEVELTDMDSYLGVLENARGALLDSPSPHSSTAPPGGPSPHGSTAPPGGPSPHGSTAPPGGPSPHGSTAPPGGQTGVLHSPTAPPGGQTGVLHSPTAPPGGQTGVLHADCLRVQEDSMPYFPSEDDLMQSQNFMQRDFVEFCDILTP